MNDEQLKDICNRNGFTVLTTPYNWPVFQELLQQVIAESPTARFADAEILQVFQSAGMDTTDKEAQIINAVRFLLAKGQGK